MLPFLAPAALLRFGALNLGDCMRKILSILAAALLAGCAGTFKTNPVDPAVARPVPAERLFAFQTRGEGTVPIDVYRDTGFLGSGCYIGIAANSQLVARMDTGEKATLYLTPGLHKLDVRADPQGKGLCALGFTEPVVESYEIKPSGVYRFRLSSRQYRRPELEPME